MASNEYNIDDKYTIVVEEQDTFQLELNKQGPQGERGLTGPMGPQGEKGDQGDQGLQGERGLTGPMGPQGDKGEKGDQGDQGLQGERGPKGDTGFSPTITEKVNTPEEYILTVINDTDMYDTPNLRAQTVIPYATQEEAEAGIATDKVMSPSTSKAVAYKYIGKVNQLGFNGVLESGVITFTPDNNNVYDIKDGYEYEIDLLFEAVGTIDGTTKVVIKNGTTNINIVNALYSDYTKPITYKDLKQVCKYDTNIGYRFIFNGRYTTKDNYNFIVIPSAVNTTPSIYNSVQDCIVSNPNLIQYTQTSSTITLKKGSKLVIPNGVGNFTYTTLINDISSPIPTGDGEKIMYTDGGDIHYIDSGAVFASGEAPTGYTYMLWYDTTENKIKYSGDSGSTWTGLYAFPIARCDNTGIKECFCTGISHFANCVWVADGVEVLIPNGKDSDGKYNNSLYYNDVTRVAVYNDTYEGILLLGPSGLLRKNSYEVRSDNYVYDGEGNKLNACPISTIKTTTGRVDIQDDRPVLRLLTSEDKVNDYTVTTALQYGMNQYYKGLMNSGAWLRSAGQWNSKSVYSSFYDWIYNKAHQEVYNSSGFTIVGEPTISNDGMASGFSSSSYVQTPQFTFTQGVVRVYIEFTPDGSSINEGIYALDDIGLMYNTTDTLKIISNMENFDITVANMVGKKCTADITWSSGGDITYKITVGEEVYSGTKSDAIFISDTTINIGSTSYGTFTGTIDLKSVKVYDLASGDPVFSGATIIPEEGFKLATEAYTDYDFVINQTDETFRLPLKNGMEGLFVNNDTEVTTKSNGIAWLRQGTGAINGVVQPYNSGSPPSGWSTLISNGISNGENVVPVLFNNLLVPSNYNLYYYCGNVVKNLQLVNVARIEEALVDKTSMTQASLASAPSNVYDDLTLLASGQPYTAPETGWFFLDKIAGSEGAFTAITNSNTDLGSINDGYSSTRACKTMLKVAKGDTVKVEYTATGTTRFFRFYYDVGTKINKN